MFFVSCEFLQEEDSDIEVTVVGEYCCNKGNGQYYDYAAYDVSKSDALEISCDSSGGTFSRSRCISPSPLDSHCVIKNAHIYYHDTYFNNTSAKSDCDSKNGDFQQHGF